MYEKYETEREALKQIIYAIGKLPSLDFKYMDKFLDEAFEAKSDLKTLLQLGPDLRREYRISGSNVISESHMYQILSSYINTLYNDASRNRNNLTAKHRQLLNPLMEKDTSGRTLAEMVGDNLINVDGRDLKFSRYLTQFCTNESFVEFLNKSPLRGHLNGKYQTYDTFISAVFEHASNSKRALVISANPLDIMLASDKFGTTRSCHSLDGDRSSGNTVLALSKFTGIVMLRQESPAEYPFQKVARMWLHIDRDTNQKFVLGKAYGNIQQTQIQEIAGIISKTINDSPWNVMSKPHFARNRVGNPRGFGAADPMYWDEGISAFAACETVASKQEVASGDVEVHPFFLFPPGKCLECSAKCYDPRGLACASCSKKSPKCKGCDTWVRLSAKGITQHKGDAWCKTCYDRNFFNCKVCDTHGATGDGFSLPSGSRAAARNTNVHVCQACYNTRFQCPCCKQDQLPTEKNPVTGERGNVCGECLDKHYKICSHCQVASTRGMPKVVNGEIVAVLCTPCYVKDKAQPTTVEGEECLVR